MNDAKLYCHNATCLYTMVTVPSMTPWASVNIPRKMKLCGVFLRRSPQQTSTIMDSKVATRATTKIHCRRHTKKRTGYMQTRVFGAFFQLKCSLKDNLYRTLPPFTLKSTNNVKHLFHGCALSYYW